MSKLRISSKSVKPHQASDGLVYSSSSSDGLAYSSSSRFTSISVLLTSFAPSSGAYPLWKCACGGKGYSNPFLYHIHINTYTYTHLYHTHTCTIHTPVPYTHLYHTHLYTHEHMHTHTFTHTHIQSYMHNRPVVLCSSSVIAMTSETRCEMCRYISTSHGSVHSVSV